MIDDHLREKVVITSIAVETKRTIAFSETWDYFLMVIFYNYQELIFFIIIIVLCF